ncbi:hypothetical protein [Cohnella rhizosphaerae]|uniref:Uncharacterized protein n=1 Tax=Cohnella rhizosphaerae TaxID=1457232 RepID=A0A9X4KPS6_9BACL|nr:hypothetical protein [Cohnella rhizosphaerae]MDG0808535.1 hypothetical protein [Cohnella rhizosphaerae]
MVVKNGVKKNDLDVVWLDGDLHADTIFSVWFPLKMSLQCVAGDTFSYQGMRGTPHKGIDCYNGIIENIDRYLPFENVLVKELYQFAELSSTRANVMRLPERQMQRRGIFYRDQMPKTLYECFGRGRFNKYFGSDESVTRWIEEEDLEMFFEDNSISRDNIKPLIPRMQASETEWLKESKDILEMLVQYNKILLQRSEALQAKGVGEFYGVYLFDE